MIELEGVSKRYGSKLAVDNVTFSVHPGRVTGFLGPNGAGKSTTMRLILGLDAPTEGSIRVNGRPYREHRDPMRQVGALLEARAAHPGRSARNHLRSLAYTHGIADRRVDDVIEMAGLDAVADKRVGLFSLGMGQRLGMAVALLGDPAILMLDEPVNGLDPEGVLWVRQLTRRLADEGRTVFLSSHLMTEMAMTADHVIVLGRGRVLADSSLSHLLASSVSAVRVRTPFTQQLAENLKGPGVSIEEHGDVLQVTGLTAAAIGETAARAGLALHELAPVETTLEATYMDLTQDDVEYRSEIAR